MGLDKPNKSKYDLACAGVGAVVGAGLGASVGAGVVDAVVDAGAGVVDTFVDAGAGLGAVAGAVGICLGIAGASVVIGGAVISGAVIGAVAEAVGIEKPRLRHALIGGFSAAVLYAAVVCGVDMGYDSGRNVGYDSGREKELTPFKTVRYEGIVVERNDGTRIPYLGKDGEYISLEEMRKAGNFTSEEWRDRESEILKVMGGGK